MIVVSWLITATVVVTLVPFAIALVAIMRLPLGERPETPIYDRLGRPEGEAANPDYHENPGEPPMPGSERSGSQHAQG